MTKLAGILSLDGAPADPTLAARLLAPSDRAEMRRDARTWSGDSVTLGCVDAQPLVHEASACVAVLDGRIDNRVELRARLSDLAHDAPDAVYVLKAYEEWGTQFASRLLGDFACAIWDGRRGRLLLARDPIGARPLYHAAHRERFLFASTVEQLFRDPALPREIDDDAAVRALYMRPSGEAAFYRAVRRVRAGHVVEVDGPRVRPRRYWHWPEAPPEARVASGEEPEQFRALFFDAVRSRLRGPRAAAVPLSGGMDSSAIACVAGRLAGDDGKPPFRAYSWIFPTLPVVDETPYARAATSRYGIPHTVLAADDCRTLSTLETWCPFCPEPYFNLYDAAYCRLLDAASADGVGTMLMTVGADELTAGSPHYLADWLLHGHWRPALRELARRRDRGLRHMTASVVFPLLPTRAQAALKYRALLVHERWMPSAIRDRYGGELAIVSSGPASWWRVRRRFVAHSGGAPYSYFSRLASLYGMEVSYPFLDVRIVDFLLRTPPDALYTNGRPKALVREALGDILPPAIRDRTDNPAPAALVDSSLREHGAAFLRALLVDSELERRGYVVPGPWKHSVERYLRGEDDLRGVCWNSLTVEMWLRAQEDRLPPLPQKPEVTAVAG